MRESVVASGFAAAPQPPRGSARDGDAEVLPAVGIWLQAMPEHTLRHSARAQRVRADDRVKP